MTTIHFPRACKLHSLYARKEQNHRFPHVTLRDGWLVATDNRVLVAIETGGVKLHRVVNINPDAIRAACSVAKGDLAYLDIDPDTGIAGVKDGPRWNEPPGAPIPDPPRPTEEATPRTCVAFNARLLNDLRTALGGDQLNLTFFDDVVSVTIVDDDAGLMHGRIALIQMVSPK